MSSEILHCSNMCNYFDNYNKIILTKYNFVGKYNEVLIHFLNYLFVGGFSDFIEYLNLDSVFQ